MFTGLDYIVFLLMLVVSAGIGLYYGCTGGKQNTTKEFLMADRHMGVLPVSLSLLATFMSAIAVLGTPAEMYVFGTQYWMVWIGYVIMIPLAAYFFLPVFYNLKLTSVFEYLEMRYDRGIRLIVSIMYIINMLLYMALALYTPALALTIVTDLSVWFSVLSVGVVCMFYTALGGMKAVMWTDVFQIGIMFIGLFAILIKGSLDHGGFGNIWTMMEEGDRIHFLDFDPDPRTRHTVWSLSIGASLFWVSVYGVNQAQVQRCLSTPNLRTAQIALWLNLPGLTALLTICSMCGFVVYAQYRNCDPLTRTNPIKKDQLLPLYVIKHLDYPCVPGLFTASVFSGALSSISSGLNALAAVTLQDMVRPYCLPSMTEITAAKVSKGLAVGFGVLMILLTYVASHLGGVLQVVAV
ncbi:Sodium-coupled monocarboxylate transporter 1 [Lamellibrachia satsuma]|nr:Sodium-coupled monocarboxylate transporter 1 [Lamellibrachia satsuma]